MSLNTWIDFIQQQDLIKKYNHDKCKPYELIFTDTYIFNNNIHIVDINMK